MSDFYSFFFQDEIQASEDPFNGFNATEGGPRKM